MAERNPVVFVAGTGRTGSTLVGNLLGSALGAVSIGEVRRIWSRGVPQDWACGCEELIHTCRFGTAVLGNGYGGRQP